MGTRKKLTEQNNIIHGISRRDFIKAAGAAAIGIGTGACASLAGQGTEKIKSKRPLPEVCQRVSEERFDYDVVVIGTGMGGSAAGAVAALNGLRTLILEKNPRPGGSCSYYEKEGFHVDTGAHMFIRGNEGPFGSLTKRLGMGMPIDFITTQNTLEIRGINLNAVVPRNAFGRALNLPRLAWQAGINPVQIPSIMNLYRKIYFMPESEIEKLDDISIDEFMMRYTGSEEARSMIAGLLGLMLILPPEEASAGESIWNLKKLMHGMSVSYPKGGSSVISETFLGGAQRYGAKLCMQSGVRKIEVAEGMVDSVILDNGEKIKTRAVISTTSVKDTVLRLVGEEYFPASYIDRVKAIIPSFTAVQAKLALKKEIIKAGCLLGGIPITSDMNIIGDFTKKAFTNAAAGIQGDYIPIYAPVPTSFDRDLAPEGCQLVTAVALAPPLGIELKESRQSWIDGMMRTLNAMIPDLQENLIFCDTWSVEMLAEWTGKSDGSAISTGQAVNQVSSKRPSHKTPISGLYLAGDCAGPARGVGTELACQSGMDCADLVARDIKYSSETRSIRP
jgi:prolycopene isomerase